MIKQVSHPDERNPDCIDGGLADKVRVYRVCYQCNDKRHFSDPISPAMAE